MRILITNNTLDFRGGSELYVRDLAIALLKRGHMPIAYSTKLGDIAQEIRAATVPVIDSLDALSVTPDIIHGHHHLDTMTALLRYPGVPAVYFCHGWFPWEENPPRFPRILRYVAVDHTCRDRLLFEHAIPEDRVQVLLNFVDLERFKPRGPLPARPQRALIFSNNANEYTHTRSVREACARIGITVDVIGSNAGNACARPEEILGRYDLVFAKGRAALESLAVGAAVILCDTTGSGPMVTTGEFGRLRPLNFGVRALRDPLDADVIERQIALYDAEDAAKVSRLVRSSAGCDAAVEQIISLYQEVVEENISIGKPDWNTEAQAATAYLRWLGPTLKEVDAAKHRAFLAESARDQVRAECDQMQARLVEQEQTLQTRTIQFQEGQQRWARQIAVQEEAVKEISSRAAVKEAQLERITNLLGWRLLSHYGPIKHRFVLPMYKSIRKVFGSERRHESDQSNATPISNVDQNHGHSSPVGTQETIQRHPSLKDIFSDIYHRRAWGQCESVSGPGSGVARTAVFRDEVAVLLKEINARTVLDAGCGDFNWMKHVRLDLEQYIGVDVVPELISANQREYGNAVRAFLDVDITRDKLPRVDVILSRDCLVHFSFKDIFGAIQNFKESGSTYLLATTFKSVNTNTDINTGEWRALNLQIFPFNFREPLKLIDEKRTHGGVSLDKYLGLWALQDLPL